MMTVEQLAEQLAQMVSNGKGDHVVVHANGVGKETAILGFEVVDHASFLPASANDRTRELARRDRERCRLRLFTHSPF